MKLKTSQSLAEVCCLPLGAWAGGGSTAQVQSIHICADLAAASVDVYENGTMTSLSAWQLHLWMYPPGCSWTWPLPPRPNTSVSDAIFDQTFTLADGGTYIIVASGIVSPSGYSPATPYSLAVYDLAEQSASMGNTMCLFIMEARTRPPWKWPKHPCFGHHFGGRPILW